MSKFVLIVRLIVVGDCMIASARKERNNEGS